MKWRGIRIAIDYIDRPLICPQAIIILLKWALEIIMKKYLFYFCICFLSTLVNAAPLSFNFTQSGFEEGASVVGMFTGEDLNADGQLSEFSGEITSFMMEFSGNSLVSSFSLGFADLFGLVYDLDGGPLGDGFSLDIEGIGADSGIFLYEVGPGPVGECGVGIDCASISDGVNISSSKQLVLVSPKVVPIPAAVWLFGSGLMAIVGFRKSKGS
jgi:hypothetical protein